MILCVLRCSRLEAPVQSRRGCCLLAFRPLAWMSWRSPSSFLCKSYETYGELSEYDSLCRVDDPSAHVPMVIDDELWDESSELEFSAP